MLYVDPAFARRGVGAALIDALVRTRARRAAPSASTSDVSDTAKPLFERQGFVAQRRNLVPLGDQWLGNTTMTKTLAKAAPPRRRRGIEGHDHDPRTPLSLRHDAARRRVDDRRRLLARGQAADRRLLDELGVDYVEGGYPGANPIDTRFFERKPTRRARFCAFGMTKRPGRSAANDPGVAALLAADADAIVFVAKTWDYHVHVALGCTLEENLACIEDSVQRGDRGGTRGDGRLRAFLRRLQGQSRPMRWIARGRRLEAGARWVVLCDTNGGTLPDEVERIVGEVVRASSRASGSASTRTTTPTTRSPIRWRRFAPARARSRER